MMITDIISIDVGNTRTHVGIVTVQGYECRFSTAFPTEDLDSVLRTAVDTLTGLNAGKLPKIAAVSGVVKHGVVTAENVLAQAGCDVHVLNVLKTLPLSFRYTTPETLGTDRIANLLYAHEHYPDDRVIIISAGTALVIDCLDDHCFLGGFILPGAVMQFKALHTFTDGLPDIDITSVQSIQRKLLLPGTSTEQCMTSGVFHGLAGAINSIVGTFSSPDNDNRLVICATGGDWPVFAPLVNFSCNAVPDMTLIGTALFALLDAQS